MPKPSVTYRDHLFGRRDRDVLACVLDSKEGAIVKNLMCSVDFLKLDHELFTLKKQKMAKCMAYTNIKVQSLVLTTLPFAGQGACQDASGQA